jgi:parallel beta-helix repeat protein
MQYQQKVSNHIEFDKISYQEYSRISKNDNATMSSDSYSKVLFGSQDSLIPPKTVYGTAIKENGQNADNALVRVSASGYSDKTTKVLHGGTWQVDVSGWPDGTLFNVTITIDDLWLGFKESVVQGHPTNAGEVILYATTLVAEVDFEEDCNIYGEKVQFYGNAYGGKPPYSWSWDFGDGDTSLMQNPIHQFISAGIFNVSLKVIDGIGQIDTDYYTIKINEFLSVDAGGSYYAPKIYDNYVRFIGNVSSGCPPYSFLWDFDDSDGIQIDSEEQNPFYYYNENGNFIVTLKVTDDRGYTKVDTAIVTTSIDNAPLIHVDDDGTADYTRIQDAIDNASYGDIIFVHQGNYSKVIVNKTVTIIGENQKNTFINSDENRISSDYVSLIGFTIKTDGGALNRVLIINSDNVIVSHCIFNNAFNGIDILHRKNILITNCQLAQLSWGIEINCLSGTSKATGDCIIDNCTITNSYRGIYVLGDDGYNISIINCSIDKCGGGLIPGAGIRLDGTKNMEVDIYNCDFYDNEYAIELIRSHNNKIVDCEFYQNDEAFHIWWSYNNKIISNNFVHNKYGVKLLSNTKNNIIYHNNFFYSTEYSAVDYNYTNIWDDGYPSGGNYWDDYTGVDANGDGIGDTPYEIPGVANEDRYPLFTCNEQLPPFKPDKPSGPDIGKKNISYNFSTSCEDFNSDIIFYDFSWGDGSNSGWIGPFHSGQNCSASHHWLKSGKYTVKVKAKDNTGLFSIWSESTNIKISYPSTPNITGPTSGRINETLEYSFVSYDPDNDDLLYFINWWPWDNPGWYGPYESGESFSVTHRFIEEGKYQVASYVIDIDDVESGTGRLRDIIITKNRKPEEPAITGPSIVSSENNYSYSFLLHDLDLDTIELFIDWGDGNITGWLGPYDSGITITLNHSWSEKGIYRIKAKARDTYDGSESDWGTLRVFMPKNKIISSPFIQFLKNHPRLFPILKHILKL